VTSTVAPDTASCNRSGSDARGWFTSIPSTVPAELTKWDFPRCRLINPGRQP
jgi:hypothetical protein